MPTDNVSEFVHNICRMDRFGGRCVRTDTDTWEVVDVNQWTEEQNSMLRCKFPRVAAKVVTNRKSLSGFSIILQAQKVSRAWVSLLVCAVMMTTMAALCKVWSVREIK